MFIFRLMSINGLELDASKPIDPKIRSFLEGLGAKIKHDNGYITLTGDFSFTFNDIKREILGIPSSNEENIQDSSYVNSILTLAKGGVYNYGIKAGINSNIQTNSYYNYGVVAVDTQVINAEFIHNSESPLPVYIYEKSCEVYEKLSFLPSQIMDKANAEYSRAENQLLLLLAPMFFMMLAFAFVKKYKPATTIAQIDRQEKMLEEDVKPQVQQPALLFTNTSTAKDLKAKDSSKKEEKPAEFAGLKKGFLL